MAFSHKDYFLSIFRSTANSAPVLSQKKSLMQDLAAEESFSTSTSASIVPQALY